MTNKTSKRPRDPNQLAKAVVDLATVDEAERAWLVDDLKRQKDRSGNPLGAEKAVRPPRG